mmetsp:Transcript_33121/g.107115  ORF Transcript_33121/g.107115 Transcript_33121/m.107115 type:complete len:221 (-) Transcript_33121:716-1378(-)
MPRHRRLHQGGSVRPLLRLLQHPDPDLRGRARLPPRPRAGARWHHPERRQASIRVRRGDGAKGDGDHSQGVRGRIRRHVLQAPAGRPELRVAIGRGCGDGGQGRGRDHLPRQARGRGDARIRAQVRQPAGGGAARLRRRGHPAERDAHAHLRGPGVAQGQARAKAVEEARQHPTLSALGPPCPQGSRRPRGMRGFIRVRSAVFAVMACAVVTPRSSCRSC